jgi:phenylpropionate dioxygenase-like ring-hydroxylating dioxygenase large terminal subunit
MNWLRNAWYVAAWDREVRAGEILSRRLLNEPVVLFRDEAGTAKALAGVCPHRYASLARGKLIGGTVQCGYHGLRFDGAGKCVHNPFGSSAPPNATVRSYPVVERYSAIWIWMGAPDLADPATIPDFGFQDPAVSFVGQGYLHVKANYELEIENILDLSHIEFLHPTTLGSGMVSAGRYESKQDGDTVWSNRDIAGEVMPDHLSRAMGVEPGKPADRWIHVRWDAPACMVVFAGAVPAGRPYSDGFATPTGHLFTPETERTSHYWYSIAFPRSMPGGEEFAQRQVEFLSMPFKLEDLPMLEDQQANLGDGGLRGAKLAWLPGDAAGARARQILQRKIDAEVAASGATALAR